MMLQRYKFYPAILLLVFTIMLCSACGSARFVKINTESTVRSTIESYIKAMNEEDIKTLDLLYANDFISYEPSYKLPKKQLLASIQKGFEQQDYRIEAKIIEIISGPTVATAQLRWIIKGADKEVIFAKNLLQIWKKDKESWKLSRILFFTISEVPELEDFNF